MLLVALLATVSGRARAEPLRAALTVTRDDGTRDCPDSANLAGRVEQVAGKRLFAPSSDLAPDTWVTVEFARDFGGFRAVISAKGQRQGTRTLDDIGPECASLADAVAITLAILLDPATTNESALAAANGQTAPATPKPSALAPSVTAAPYAPPPDSAPERASAASENEAKPLVFGVEASAGASLAVLEHVAPFVEAGASARPGDVFAIGAGGGFVLPDRVDYGSGSVDVSLGYGYVRACGNVLPRRPIKLEACVEPMLGGLRGSGKDYAERDTEWVFYSAAAALVQAYGPISESVLWAFRARILAPLVRHGFSVERGAEPEPAFELSAVGGMLSFGIEAEL